ncbi:hypothetical protein CCAX7_000470 [Capsulimonas corticalis]|uniref:Uncharacterized protein n=1 Tax=Capsulimonas corticalis TaxID=2219043 RepID=A0A402CRD0_9BACT|nr:phage minor head protein [Capsulimonas corticalis]BDI27996.1 hypothetical protein CCAX7_000470 [Capsulimonas corticalis]
MADIFEISELAKEYAQLIRASRQKQMQLDRDTIAHVLGLLHDTLDALQEDIRSIPRGILAERFQRDLERSISRHVTTFGERFKASLDGGIEAAALNVSEREADLLRRLSLVRTQIHPEHSLHVAAGAAQIGVEFGRVQAEVLDRLYARVYPDGLKLSQRLYNLDRDARRSIADTLFSGVAQGQSARKLAEALRPLLTAPGVENVRYKAMRIARTEINSAYREGHIASVTDENGKLKPWVEAIGWRLSPAHPRTDICDAWAGDDTEGLGAGNYSSGNVPPGHPHCLCYTVTLLASLPDQQFVSHPPKPDDVPESQRKYYGQPKPDPPAQSDS